MIDWDRPLAFVSTGERVFLQYFPGTEQRYGVQCYAGKIWWYAPDGTPETNTPAIMNVETAYTRRADAARRVAEKRAARAAMEQHPLWGSFG